MQNFKIEALESFAAPSKVGFMIGFALGVAAHFVEEHVKSYIGSHWW